MLALLASLAIGDKAQASSCHTLLNTAALTVESGGSCSTGGEMKTFLESGTGTTVKGNVGGRDGIPVADFTSSSSLQAKSGFGIAPSGTNSFQDLTISLEPNGNSGFTFGALAFREKMPNGPESLTIKAFGVSNDLLGEVTLTKAEVKHLLHTNFLVSSSEPIASVVLESSGFIRTSAFRFADVVDPPVVTPVPAALPLFATGLGALGLLGWRRKRKATAIAA